MSSNNTAPITTTIYWHIPFTDIWGHADLFPSRTGGRFFERDTDPVSGGVWLFGGRLFLHRETAIKPYDWSWAIRRATVVNAGADTTDLLIDGC